MPLDDSGTTFMGFSNSNKIAVSKDLKLTKKYKLQIIHSKLIVSMRYQLAFATLITAATLSSFNGVFIRALADMTDWQIVFWRHLLIGLMLCLGLTLSYRSGLINAFKKIGRLGIFGAVAFGLSLLFLTMALHNSPIANVMFTLALVPILTALIAWATLRERIQKVTWIAMIGAAIGVALMVVGHLNGGSMKGAGLSAGCAVTVSIFAVILRWGRDLNMIPMFAVGSCTSSESFGHEVA